MSRSQVAASHCLVLLTLAMRFTFIPPPHTIEYQESMLHLSTHVLAVHLVVVVLSVVEQFVSSDLRWVTVAVPQSDHRSIDHDLLMLGRTNHDNKYFTFRCLMSHALEHLTIVRMF